MYYYASRNDKNNNRLMTSYGNAASQKKYGGAEARLFNGIVVLKYQTGEFAEINPNEFDIDKHVLVRSRIHNPNPTGSSGKFILKSLKDGQWVDTPFRASSYGEANSIMKAVVDIYGDIIIIEETDGSVASNDGNNADF